MYIKNIEIQNFKCFGEEPTGIEFKIPDGETRGSGLNIFFGENNSGKSTIFEAIEYLRVGPRKGVDVTRDIKNKNASAETDVVVTATFVGDNIADIIKTFGAKIKKDVLSDCIDEATGTLKITRSRKEKKEEKEDKKGKKEKTHVLKVWNPNSSTPGGAFENRTGIDAPIIALFQANFIWAETDPSEEARFGASTTCGNLLKEIMNDFSDKEPYKKFQSVFKEVFNTEGSGLKKDLKDIEEKTQKIFAEQFGEVDIAFKFDEQPIDMFFKRTSIEINDGVLTDMVEKGSGMQRSMALALLRVYSEIITENPKGGDLRKPLFLFLDEPEICLHPHAQLKLLDSILEISKHQQVFVATHTPYFFKNPSCRNSGLFCTSNKGNQGAIIIEPMHERGWGIWRWSPTWGEINYYVFKVPTIDFHNELYGYLQNKTQKSKISEFDEYLKVEAKIQNTEQYQDDRSNKAPQNITICTYIRHQIHHPENTKNPKKYYEDPEKLKESIELLIAAIEDFRVKNPPPK